MWNDFEKDKHILETVHTDYIDGSGIDKNEILKIHNENPYSHVTRAKIIKYILENVSLGICPEDFFQDTVDFEPHHIGLMIRPLEQKKHEETIELFSDMTDLYYFTGGPDYSHTAPDWKNVLSLGIRGLKSRAENKDEDFYKGIVLAYEGAEIFLKRLEKLARNVNTERMNFLADSLCSLTENPPQNTYEALLLMYFFFYFQSDVECTYLRAFGSLDMLLYPFYENDIKSGTFTKEQIRTLIKYFIQKLDSRKVWANQPFALCGVEGQPAVNELSYIILEEFIKLKPVYTKVHIRHSPKIPENFILKICDSIKANGNSFVFINNSVATKALVNLGQDEKDALDYGIVGCYEIFSQGTEIPCSLNGFINMSKAVEAVIFEGEDAITGKKIFDLKQNTETFDDFKNAVKEYLLLFINNSIKLTVAQEKGYTKTQFTPFISSTYDSCIEKGLDIYQGGAKYNSSSITLIGTASVADILYAVKTLVYDEKRVTLKELREILKNDWQGREDLRHYALSLAKYGNNLPEVDCFAREITDFCLKNINGRKNGHGGVFRGGTWSIDYRLYFGEHTGASADGRLSKEPLSKNICATNACDKKGVTAHILSASKLDSTIVPDGTVLDLSLSHSAVIGNGGSKLLKATLDTYMIKGGFAVQYNVLNPQELKNAQKNPENYKTLQVRLCGWNVLFNDLTRKEQDEFILQSENLC